MKRVVIVPGIYKHFKHTENGIPNNYMYCTIGISEPIDFEEVESILFENEEITKNFMEIRHTELNKTNTVMLHDGKWRHDKDFSESSLVLYKSLYDDSPVYARPIDVFLSEVDHEKHPSIKQNYRFQLIGRIL